MTWVLKNKFAVTCFKVGFCGGRRWVPQTAAAMLLGLIKQCGVVATQKSSFDTHLAMGGQRMQTNIITVITKDTLSKVQNIQMLDVNLHCKHKVKMCQVFWSLLVQICMCAVHLR